MCVVMSIPLRYDGVVLNCGRNDVCGVVGSVRNGILG